MLKTKREGTFFTILEFVENDREEYKELENRTALLLKKKTNPEPKLVKEWQVNLSKN